MVLDTGRGHGGLGFRPGMLTFNDLVRLPVYEKRVIVECQPALLVEDWSFDSSDTWVAVFETPFRDERLDAVAVVTSLDSGLTRVETIDDCRSTAGTYYFDFFKVPASQIARWDDGVTLWDDGVTRFDQFSFLYVHLFDGSDPNDAKVIAKVGVYIASKGLVEPSLGSNKISNGDFEDGFVNWDIGVSGTGVVSVETLNPIDGASSARWDLIGVINNFKSIQYNAPINVVEGEIYRVSGLYCVDSNNDPNAKLRVDVIVTSKYVQEDGRNINSAVPTTDLTDTGGKVRRFIFDFIATITGSVTLQFYGSASNNPASIPFWDDGSSTFDGPSYRWDDFGFGKFPVILLDEINVRRVWRFNYHEHRVSNRAVPEVQTGSRDIYFTAQQIGTGGIDFVNGDGYFESLVELFNWESHEMFIKVGGAFQNGDELLVDDYRTRFKAIVRRDQVDDVRASFDLEDVRSFILQTIPTRIYSLPEFPDLDSQAIGSPRPVWFGQVENIAPTRIFLITNGYATYELADTNDIPNGIKSIDNVWSYLTKADADEKNASRRRLLVEGPDYSTDLSLARLSVLRDVQLFEITADNNAIDWSETPGLSPIYSGFVPVGLYMAHELANAMSTVLNAQGSGTKGAAYADSTHLFSLGRSVASFNLHLGDGPNKGRAIWSTIGFTVSSNLTGSLTYNGDTSVYTDPETDHFIRVDGVGARDTVPIGIYTGVSGGPIEKGSDIVRTIWNLFIRQPLSLVDEQSFIDARTSAPQTLGMYINATQDIRSIFQCIQNSNRANIVINQEGIIHMIVNQPGEVPANTEFIDDSDYISFNMRKQLDDVYGTIRVLYSKDASTGDYMTFEVTNQDTAMLYNRSGSKDFETYLVDESDAEEIGNSILGLASKPQRVAEITIKGLVELVEGNKIILNRERGIDDSGSIDNELFRVLQVRNSQLSAKTDIIAVEDT